MKIFIALIILASVCYAQPKKTSPTDQAKSYIADSLQRIDEALSGKLDKSDTSNYYKKTQVNILLSQKQNTVTNLADTSKYLETTDALNPAKVTQTISYRFTNDTEKNTWNNKQNAIPNLADTSKYMEFRDSTLFYKKAIIDNLIDDLNERINAIDTVVSVDSLTFGDTVYVVTTETDTPVAINYSSSNVNDTSATLKAIIIPYNLSTNIKVFWGTSTTWSDSASIDAVTNLSFINYAVTGLSPGTEYFFCFRATNSEGSHYSANDSLTTTEDVDVTAPAIPLNLAILSESKDSIVVQWDNVPDTDLSSYQIWTSLDGVSFSLYDSTLTNTYNFVNISNDLTLGNPDARTLDPGLITNTTASIGAWVHPSDSAAYRFIWWKTDSLSATKDSSIQYQLTSILPIKEKYYFKVKAVDHSTNASGFSDMVNSAAIDSKYVVYNLSGLDSATNYKVIVGFTMNGGYYASTDTADVRTLGSNVVNYANDFLPGGNTDDATWRVSGGTEYFDNTTVYIVNGGNYEGGFRFINVAIPDGAVIDTAYLSITAKTNASTGTANATLMGELSLTPAAFSDRTNALARSRTTSTVNWDNIPAWTGDVVYQSPNIKTVIQEIIDQTGWASGNNLALFSRNNGSGGSAMRVTYGNTADKKISLHVAWHTGSVSEETQTDTIFVDATSGHDINNTGYSRTSPFKTLSRATVEQTLSPGNVVLLKRGEEWNEPLKISSSGTEANRIVIGAYGSGDKPIISLRSSVPNWNVAGNWTSMSGDTIWRMTFPSAAITNSKRITRLWLSDVEYATCSNGDDNIGSTYLDIDNQDNLDGGATTYGVNRVHRFMHTTAPYLYVYTTGANPAAFYSNIEYPGIISADGSTVEWFAVSLSDADYVTLQNIDARGGMHSAIGMRGSDNVIIDSCVIGKYSKQIGFMANTSYISANDATSDDGELKNSTVDSDFKAKFYQHYGNEVIAAFGVALADGANGWDVHHNTVCRWANNLFVGSGISTPSINNKFYNNEVYYTESTYAKGGQVNGYSPNHNTNTEYYNNYFHDLTSGLNICGSNIEVGYNVFDDIRAATNEHASSSNSGYGIQVILPDANPAAKVDSNYFYNNTLYNTYREPFMSLRASTWVENNLMIDCSQGYTTNDLYIRSSDGNKDKINNNLFFRTGATTSVPFYYWTPTTTSYTLTQLNALPETNGDESNNNIQPTGSIGAIVTNAASGDYSLPNGSPAINAGKTSSYMRTTDKNGNSLNGVRDIGSLEKQ